MTTKIGRVEYLDLRKIWENEPQKFSTWLYENIDALSESVGLSIECLELEKKVDESRYSIDIWAQDDDGDPIVIENQLEITDQKHMGQIVTYAVNMEAKTVIWIASECRQEHINVVNWLNEFTDKDFYLVELKAIRIGNSEPAPQFNVICRPSAESKQLGVAKIKVKNERELRHARKELSDTVIVPANEDGFKKVFLGENRWHSVRISAAMRERLKYIAAYQTAPISAVTHIAEIKEIVDSPFEEGKVMVIFKGPAKEIKPIPGGKRNRFQSLAYCEYELLKKAKNTDEAQYPDEEYLIKSAA